jgi:hypothetical protein
VYNRWYEDKASSGVAFIDPDTGFQNTIIINGGWGWARILSRRHNTG